MNKTAVQRVKITIGIFFNLQKKIQHPVILQGSLCIIFSLQSNNPIFYELLGFCRMYSEFPPNQTLLNFALLRTS